LCALRRTLQAAWNAPARRYRLGMGWTRIEDGDGHVHPHGVPPVLLARPARRISSSTTVDSLAGVRGWDEPARSRI